MRAAYHFDPIDREQVRLLASLPPGRRVRIMLDARELALGLIRGRLRRQYPHLSPQAINMKVLEEVARADPLVWRARPEDVIVGKLMAWSEGRSRKHETDIFEMLVFHYLAAESDLDERYVDARAASLGAEVVGLWEVVKEAARREAGQKSGA
jgi:hypothetical protein